MSAESELFKSISTKRDKFKADEYQKTMKECQEMTDKIYDHHLRLIEKYDGKSETITFRVNGSFGSNSDCWQIYANKFKDSYFNKVPMFRFIRPSNRFEVELNVETHENIVVQL